LRLAVFAQAPTFSHLPLGHYCFLPEVVDVAAREPRSEAAKDVDFQGGCVSGKGMKLGGGWRWNKRRFGRVCTDVNTNLVSPFISYMIFDTSNNVWGTATLSCCMR
jgi:hypothetical protein